MYGYGITNTLIHANIYYTVFTNSAGLNYKNTIFNLNLNIS